MTEVIEQATEVIEQASGALEKARADVVEMYSHLEKVVEENERLKTALVIVAIQTKTAKFLPHIDCKRLFEVARQALGGEETGS